MLPFIVPALSVLLGMLSLVFVVTDQRRFRQARQHTLTSSPTVLRKQALDAARHAVEYDLPESAALCYQLEAFWNRCVDDEPAPLEIEIVGAGPKHEPDPFMEELQSHMLEPIAEPEPEFDLDAFVARTSRVGDETQVTFRSRPPAEVTRRVSWQLKGTDEDAYVLEALRKHGVKVAREGTTAHLVGTVSAVQDAEAEYRSGWAARRAKRR